VAHANRDDQKPTNTILAADERGWTPMKALLFNPRVSAFIRGHHCFGLPETGL
jgi:hypothetical protein